MRIRALGALLVTSTLLLAGCGDSGDDSGGGSSADSEAVALMNEGKITDKTGESEVTVEAVDNTFKPKYIEVKKGTTVTFVNDGRNIHNVLPVDEDAFTAIQADDFDPGDEGTVTFDETGEFPYYCSLHGTATKGMIGGIKVVD